jgi:hypothetical protein
LERKVQALRDFIGGSDPTANASKRRSYADKAKSILNYTDSSAAERAAAATSRGSAKSCSDGLLGSYALRTRGSEVMPPSDALVGLGPSYCIGSLC